MVTYLYSSTIQKGISSSMTKQVPWINKIISGGQAGADRAGLDVAIVLEIPHAGWCPADREAEDGRIPDCYNLNETDSSNHNVRTEMNVRDSNGTIVFSFGKPVGGSELTIRLAEKHKKPCLHIDLESVKTADCVKRIRGWLKEHKVKVLNIAGSRESRNPGIYKKVKDVLIEALK